MFPFISILGRQISTYTVLAAAGLLLSGFYACRMAKKSGYDDNDMISLLLVGGAGAFVGGHLLYALVNVRHLLILRHTLPLIPPFKMIAMLFGGMVFYGGLFGGLAAGFVYGKKKKLDMAAFSDMVSPAIPLMHIFGRLGCFFYGCCYGVPCSFGVYLKNAPLASVADVRLFPVQLLEAVVNSLLFLLLHFLYKKGRFKGRLLYIYLLLYAIARFFIEFLRGDIYRGFVLGISTSQFISVLVIAFSLVKLLLLKRKKCAAN